MIRLNTDYLVRHATLRQLQILITVVKTGGYTKAAKYLHLTQPTVSMQIQKLSDSLGMPLFEIFGKKLHLTAAGAKVLDAAENIIERLGHLGNDMAELSGEVKGPLQLSVVSTTTYFMPHLIGEFLKIYPKVEPKLDFTNRATLLDRLYHNMDDFVVMGQTPEDAEHEVYPFMENVLVAVAHPAHKLARKKKISLDELVKERFIVREPGSGTRKHIDTLVEDEHGLKIEPYMELGNSEAIKQAVMAGLGIAVLSLYSLSLEIDAGKLKVLNVEHFPIRRRWYAAHRKGKKLSLVARTFLDFILENSEKMFGR